jgi:hypothetical protein
VQLRSEFSTTHLISVCKARLFRQEYQAIQAAHGSFVIEPALSNAHGADRVAAEVIIKGSLAESIRSVMLIAAVLALSAAAVGTLLPRSVEITDTDDR